LFEILHFIQNDKHGISLIVTQSLKTGFRKKFCRSGLLIVIIIWPRKSSSVGIYCRRILFAPNKWGRYKYLSISRLANRIGNGNRPLYLNDVMATDDMGAIQNPCDDG
jgi:hypothetical protein